MLLLVFYYCICPFFSVAVAVLTHLVPFVTILSYLYEISFLFSDSQACDSATT